jgi:hypothetical protein
MKTASLFLRASAIPVAVLIAFAVTSAEAAPAAQVGTCSVARIATEVPLRLVPAETPVQAKANSAFADNFPNATTIESASVRIVAPSNPALDGQDATAFTFRDATPRGRGGPPSIDAAPVRVACGVAFYEPATGAFIGDILIMEDAVPSAQ